MSEINFLQKDDRASKQSEKVRLIVVPVTTAVLAVYLVSISGLLGWWWWWSGKQTKASAEYTLLRSQVNGRKSEEVLYRRLDDRVKVVGQYLNKRADLFSQTDFLKDNPVKVIGYSVELDGYFTITVAAENSTSVRSVVSELENRFKDVFLKSISWNDKDNYWSAVYWYRGKKS